MENGVNSNPLQIEAQIALDWYRALGDTAKSLPRRQRRRFIQLAFHGGLIHIFQKQVQESQMDLVGEKLRKVIKDLTRGNPGL